MTAGKSPGFPNLKKKEVRGYDYDEKMIACVVSMICIVALVAGCTTRSSVAFTYNINNGDSVKVSVDTSDKYRLSSDLPFTISHDGVEQAEGSFIQAFAYEEYKNAVESDEKAQMLDSGSKDGNEYFLWSYDNKEFNYAILIKDFQTGLLLASTVSEEAVKECFNRLTVTCEN